MAKDDSKSKLEDKLSFKVEPVWKDLSDAKSKQIFKFAKEYMDFLTTVKTERESITWLQTAAENNGFKDVSKFKKLKAGDKVYSINRDKNIAMMVIGKEPIINGFNLVASHVDSPRLDLKQNPLYEDKTTSLALLRTHYYGGIKKYQWGSVPLALHGVVVLDNGKSVEVKVGEDPSEPVFTVPDLLPHLYRNSQGSRKLPDGLKGEELKVIVGSIPIKDEKAKTKVKLAVLDHLNKAYGMKEEDFISAELELVPSGAARDVGFDASIIGAYGQDDRLCAYTSYRSMLDLKIPKRTAMVLCIDKEEIGSTGDTGIQSRFLEMLVAQLLEIQKPGAGYLQLRQALSNSDAISADGNAGINPIFKGVHEAQNAAKMGYGIVLTKFTGSGGKYSSNDASAEFVGHIRKIFNNAKVSWQIGELGKVDEGGGGTVAKFLAELNMRVIDAGAPLLSMHSLFELASKGDVYACYKAYLAFLVN